MEDLHTYAELMQRGDETAAERLRLLENHRRRIEDDLNELSIALELVERKISGYEEVLAHGLTVEPPDHRPAPRKVRVRAPGEPSRRASAARSEDAATRRV